MLKVLYAVVTVGLFVCLFLSFERPAMAYVDPGSGLFLFQSISSIAVGAMFFLRRRLRALFGRGKGSADSRVQEKPGYTEYDKAA